MSHPFKHFRTVCRHRHAVFYLCVKAGIPGRGLLHDLSKFSPAEFIPGARYWTGTHSPNEGEREETGYSKAWMHHMGRNRHHFEYWKEYLPGESGLAPVKMPPKFFAEMVCDRIAASKIYRGKSYRDSDPYDYLESEKDRYLIHPETLRDLEKALYFLQTHGEDELFCRIKAYVKTGKLNLNEENA